MKVNCSEIGFLGGVLTLATVGGAIGSSVMLTRSRPSTNSLPKKLPIPRDELVTVKDKTDRAWYLIEFMDYECPPCKILSKDKIPELIKNKNLVLIIKNFPLKFHKYAVDAAILAEYSKYENKFKVTHNKLLQMNHLSTESINNLSKELRINKNPSLLSTIEKNIEHDRALAEKLELPGTPSFVLCKPDGSVWYLPNVFKQINSFLD